MKKIYIIIAVLLLFLSGCGQTDLPEEDMPYSVLSVADVSLGLGTRNQIFKSQFTQGDELGLYTYRNQILSHRKLTYQNPAWELESPVFLAYGSTDIYAYYPYKSTNIDPTLFRIEHDSQTDYLYSDKHTAQQSSPIVHLQMKHALCLVEFQFSGVDLMTYKYIESISIEGNALHSHATFNILTKELIYDDDYHYPATIYYWQMQNPTLEDGAKIGVMVLPVPEVTTEGELHFHFRFNDFQAIIPVPVGTIWESGKKYIYNVQVTECLLISPADPFIKEWLNVGYEYIPLPYKD